jgi:hypothetical protein
MAGGERSPHLIVPNSRQSHRGNTPALFTIRVPPKLAESYLRCEIGGYCLGRARKNALACFFGRGCQLIDDGVAHIQGGIPYPQMSQIRDHRGELMFSVRA